MTKKFINNLDRPKRGVFRGLGQKRKGWSVGKPPSFMCLFILELMSRTYSRLCWYQKSSDFIFPMKTFFFQKANEWRDEFSEKAIIEQNIKQFCAFFFFFCLFKFHVACLLGYPFSRPTRFFLFFLRTDKTRLRN